MDLTPVVDCDLRGWIWDRLLGVSVGIQPRSRKFVHSYPCSYWSPSIYQIYWSDDLDLFLYSLWNPLKHNFTSSWFHSSTKISFSPPNRLVTKVNSANSFLFLKRLCREFSDFFTLPSNYTWLSDIWQCIQIFESIPLLVFELLPMGSHRSRITLPTESSSHYFLNQTQ